MPSHFDTLAQLIVSLHSCGSLPWDDDCGQRYVRLVCNADSDELRIGTPIADDDDQSASFELIGDVVDARVVVDRLSYLGIHANPRIVIGPRETDRELRRHQMERAIGWILDECENNNDLSGDCRAGVSRLIAAGRASLLS